MKAVIIAAGTSSRLWAKTNETPKTLLPYGKGTILSTILSNFSNAGINEFVIVLGFKSKHIENYLIKTPSFGYHINVIYNPDFKKGNGISVLMSEKVVGNEPFILSMSDHIVTPGAIRRVMRSRMNKNLLLVDKNID